MNFEETMNDLQVENSFKQLDEKMTDLNQKKHDILNQKYTIDKS